MEESEIVMRANEIVSPHKLKAEMLDGIQSVGVAGDARTYLPVLTLIGPFPGWEVLEKLSTEITNSLPVSRVTFELARS